MDKTTFTQGDGRMFIANYGTMDKASQKRIVDAWCKEERLWPRRLRESHAAMMMQLAVKDKNDGAFKFWQAVKIRNGENPNSADNRRVDLVRVGYKAPEQYKPGIELAMIKRAGAVS